MNDDTPTGLNGTCTCGAVRYELSGQPEVTFACYCKTCQRQSSAPFMTYFITYAKDGFAFTKGEAKRFGSSEKLSRYFCGDCGTPICAQYNDDPDKFVVNQGTLDEPNLLTPVIHIHTAEAPVWFEINGDAPQFPHDYVPPE